MTAHSPLLVVRYTPGLSWVRHRCTIEITSSGLLRQRFSERKNGEWNDIEGAHDLQLAAQQLDTLQVAVARIDFKRLAARLERRLDASKLAIEWDQPEGTIHRVEGPIFSYGKGYHDFRQTFEPAQQFWNLVYGMLPAKFLDR